MIPKNAGCWGCRELGDGKVCPLQSAVFKYELKTELHHSAVEIKHTSLLSIWQIAVFKQRKVLSARSEILEAALLKKLMFLGVLSCRWLNSSRHFGGIVFPSSP
jgi:hypothetical protein